VIGEDAVGTSAELIEELRRRFELDIVQCAPASFMTRSRLIARELALTIRLLLSPHLRRRGSLIVCSSDHYAVLAASRILTMLGRDLDLFLYNFYLHSLGSKQLVRRILGFLLTRRVLIAAQSPVDLDFFRTLAPAVGLVLVPYGQGPVPGIAEDDVRLGSYVFAGGYTNRDYDRLIRCARNLPDQRFVIACSSLNKLTEALPSNVEVHLDLDPGAFHKLLAGALLVVIPLADDVGSSGQMVALAAMHLGKALVVADSPVVTQYLEEGINGLVYERTSDASLCSTIAGAIADTERLVRLGSAARTRYDERFTQSGYHRALLEALEARAN